MNYGMDYQGGGGYQSNHSGGFAPTGGAGTTATPSSSSGKSRKSYDEQTIVPVTIAMLLNHGSSSSEAYHHVQIVGAVRSIEQFSTNDEYQIEDGTGLLKVKQWCDDAQDCAAIMANRQLCRKEHVYLQIIGQLKDYDGAMMLVADSIRPITTGNALSHHMLHVVYVAERAKRAAAAASSSAGLAPLGIGFGGAPAAVLKQPGTSYSNNNNSNNGGGDLQALIEHAMKEASDTQEGASIDLLLQRAAGRWNEKQVGEVIQSLLAEGLIYSTIDDQHYKYTAS